MANGAQRSSRLLLDVSVPDLLGFEIDSNQPNALTSSHLSYTHVPLHIHLATTTIPPSHPPDKPSPSIHQAPTPTPLLHQFLTRDQIFHTRTIAAMPNNRRGPSGPQPREVLVSKKLSWLLRHGAEKEGLVLGKGGYANLGDVVRRDV